MKNYMIKFHPFYSAFNNFSPPNFSYPLRCLRAPQFEDRYTAPSPLQGWTAAQKAAILCLRRTSCGIRLCLQECPYSAQARGTEVR
jgi:hypothetical protein